MGSLERNATQSKATLEGLQGLRFDDRPECLAWIPELVWPNVAGGIAEEGFVVT